MKPIYAHDDNFYPEKEKTTNKYFTFKHYINDDEIVILTKNIIDVKGNPCMVVGNREVVYLKPWNIRECHNHKEFVNAYAVKLSRKWFKVYTFKNYIENFCFDGKVDTFDDLVEIAKAQDKENMPIASGFSKLGY